MKSDRKSFPYAPGERTDGRLRIRNGKLKDVLKRMLVTSFLTVCVAG